MIRSRQVFFEMYYNLKRLLFKRREMVDNKEKVYLTRDEKDNFIWIWRKSNHGSWIPKKAKDCDIVMYQREDKSLDNACSYYIKDFKKKFGMIINKKVKKCVHLDKKLLDSEDYKLVSSDGDRKR